MLNVLKFGIAAVAVLAATPASATDYLLTFTNACTTEPCSAGYYTINQNYGDTSEVDLSYYSQVGASQTTNVAVYVPAHYGDLDSVAYSAHTLGIGEIFFGLADGYSLTLNALDFAGYFDSMTDPRNTGAIRVLDLSGNVLFDSGSFIASGFGHGTQAFNITSTEGLRLQWGTGYPGGDGAGAGAFWFGIDNVSYSVSQVGGPGPGAVPEPGTWAMMLMGFGLIGTMVRRRRSDALVSIA